MTPDRLTAIGMAGAATVLSAMSAAILARAGWRSRWPAMRCSGSATRWTAAARYRKIERPSYGYFLDHSCDGLANLMIVLGIGLSPFVGMNVALIALAGYFLMSMHAFLAARVIGELRLSYMAAGPTELRLFLMLLTVAMMFDDPTKDLIGNVSGFDILIGGIGVGLILLFVVQTFAVARQLAVTDRR